MTSPDHARFADWDAAYVLGALSSADRRAFEEHLTECELCAAAVAEVVPVSALLSRVDAERALGLLAEPAADDEADVAVADGLRDAFVARVRTRRRRRRATLWSAVALAAALVVAAAIAVPLALAPTHAVQTVAFDNLAGVPLTASAGLDPVGWGTRIDLDCRYGAAGASAPAGGWPYALVVTALDGTVSEVSSWRARPDTTATLSAGTALDVTQIRSIEIRSVTTGATLMRADLPTK
ncbi:zf-HC2 domain-containing protein [Microbacterium sp. CJ88]|uniref:zf-HC2 domain-containing protein n=1 Tax=Microbacterium sp. CJ88 TaxID=3445672 RepID=UPI003F6588C9